MSDAEVIRGFIRTIPDFPRPGILFRDVAPLFADPRAASLATTAMMQPWQGLALDRIAAIEARGFVPGSAMADRLGVGLVMIRKAGKLPGAVIAQRYALEYGEAQMELHADALAPGMRVLLIDDLLATGGTAAAGIALCRRLGAEVVGAGFLIELDGLGGRAAIEAEGVAVQALCRFPAG